MIDCVCGERFSEARFALGYRVCLACGDAQAKKKTKQYTVVPMHKSNYIALFNRNDLQGINNKGGLIK
jgi:hypothetical protein